MRLLLWTALCALIFNGVAFSAHRHALHSAPVVSSVDVLHVATSDEGACALCSAAAMLEPYLPPSATVLIAPRGNDAQAITVAAAYDLLSSRAHIWRSRAPPDSAPT
ncbi:hypothetical protein [Sphingomonas sp. Mn802worker]|uniref:hypothetical protein n=1 Tax=Sphingomonas sp. Mn802worker TaxID=629773 RepID=UPI0003778CFD|nr:hypothetical protein [Sphingomonas sp. Mn802worker]